MEQPKKNFPTTEELMEVYNLFPKGNPVDAEREVKYAIITYKDMAGNKVTWDLIKTKYREYIEKRTKDDFDPQYIKTLESFVKNKDFNIDFSKEPSLKKVDPSAKAMNKTMSELELRLSGYSGTDGDK